MSQANQQASSIGSPAQQVLIQGELHSFHDRARSLLLPSAESTPTRSFDLLAAGVAQHPGQLGLMAIENSIAGALLPNYLLLEAHGLHITAEVYLRIGHALLALPGTTLVQVKQVESHPMALRQCLDIFKRHPQWRRIEAYDTAGSAQAVAKAEDITRAAIAPHWCAEAYGLQILEQSIEDNPHNWTRFVLVSQAPVEQASTKTSIAFSLSHEPGSLLDALQVMAKAGLSMTKIQSLPQVGKPWQYRFFVDFEHAPDFDSAALFTKLKTLTTDLTHLGSYAKGQHFEP